jgi:hypothetical protein
MTTLAANLSDSATEMRVNAAVTDPAEFYQIDDEIIWVAAVSTTINGSLSPVRYEDDTLWQIKERGVSTTAPASHLSGATVTPLLLGAGGGGTTPTLAEVLAAGNDVNFIPIAGGNSSVSINDDDVTLAAGDNGRVYIQGDGTVTLSGPDATVNLAADGSIQISGSNGEISISSTGDITLAPATNLSITGSGVFDLRAIAITTATNTVTVAGDHVLLPQSIPTADPGVAGEIYTDGAPSAGVPKALMVSGGA